MYRRLVTTGLHDETATDVFDTAVRIGGVQASIAPALYGDWAKRKVRRSEHEKGPEQFPGLIVLSNDLVIHATPRRHGWHRRFLFGFLGDHRLGGDQEAGD